MSLVSVIVPAYNVEDKISRCITSIINQTYKELQIIVINDGSTDHTYGVCQRYQTEDDRVQVYTTENKGVSSARNYGIDLAKGKYIVFVDADDYMEKDCISLLVESAPKQSWVIGNYYICEEKKKKIHQMYFQNKKKYGDKNDLPDLCLNRNFYCVWGKLYVTDTIKKNHLYFPLERDYGEDLIFNIKYFQYVTTFVALNKPIYNYCIQWGEGLGTRYRANEWQLQKEVCIYIKYMAETVYELSSSACDELNHFYYAQAIFTIERIVHEKTLNRNEKKRKCKEITESNFFCNILETELRKNRINILDYLVLKYHCSLWYIKIHETYVKWKGRIPFVN